MQQNAVNTKIKITMKYFKRVRKMQQRNPKTYWDSEIRFQKVKQSINKHEHFRRNKSTELLWKI